MDGSIEVKSRIDVGTVFTVYLELEKYSGTDVQSVVATELDYMDILRGKHVLLCEDNELNAEIAQLLLEHWGMIVTWEKNGKLALEAVRQDETAYDIILMDKRMAVMDGLDATVAIRDLEEASGRHIPIIAMTGDVDEESIKSCLDAGMDDHVGKPINRSELARSMVRLLKQRHCGV
jgi:CheY-like chemotaxis protein